MLQPNEPPSQGYTRSSFTCVFPSFSKAVTSALRLFFFSFVIVTSLCPTRISKVGWVKSFANRNRSSKRSLGLAEENNSRSWCGHRKIRVRKYDSGWRLAVRSLLTPAAEELGLKVESEPSGWRSWQHSGYMCQTPRDASLGSELPGVFLLCGDQ